MDRGVEKGTVTVVAFASGEASIYLSSRGGFIGGSHPHETIRKTSIGMVTVAPRCQPLAQPTLEHPLPERGSIKFHFPDG